MIGKERVRSVLKGEKPDMCPATAFLALMAAKIAGIGVKEFEEDPQKYYEGHIVAYEKFKPDVFVLYLNVFTEVEALGAEIERAPDRPSSVKTRVLEKKSNLGKLEIPDPNEDGLFPVYLEAGKRIVKDVPEAACSLAFMSPWTTAINMRGADILIFDTVEDPDYVHELMRFTTEFAKRAALCIHDRGISVGMSDSGASLNLISPPIYREFVRPYNEELIKYLKGKKVTLGVHACGYNNPIIEDIISLEPLTISIDAETSLEQFLDINHNRVTVLGNVDTHLFPDGTKEEIEAAVKNCLDIHSKFEDQKFILCTGCDLPLTSKVENIEAYFDAARKYGTY